MSDWFDVTPPSVERLTERAKQGQQVSDEELGSGVAERFLSLSEEDQAAFWANVREDADLENWYAGEPGEHPNRKNDKPRKSPVMRPFVYTPGELSLEDALSRLEGVRRKGDEWRARCPVHGSRGGSLIVSDSGFKPGTPVFHCYAGCTHQEVKDAVSAVIPTR